MKTGIALLSSLLMLAASAQAAEPPAGEEAIAEVAITSTRNPELKPYRVMSAALDAFDEYRQLAPNAALHFRLSKRGHENWYKGSWEGVSLRLAGNDTSIPLPIGADGRFTLPRSKQAFDDDAELILNQKKTLIRFGVDVRTPGLPLNVRRLGDLRLECKALLAMGKKELNFAARATLSTYFLGSDWCASRRAKFYFALPDWTMNTTVVHAGKRTPFEAVGYHFLGPLADKSLPDDALMEFEFWSDASAERKKQFVMQWPLYLKSSVNKWGAGPAFERKENGLYSARIALQPGKWRFRMESKGREVSLGTRTSTGNASLGPEQVLEWHEETLKLEVDQAGTYEFSLDLQNPDRLVATIARADPVAVAQ